jgi:hypothetical protein
MIQRLINVPGINIRLNPLAGDQIIYALNVTTEQIGAKIKRPGYVTYLGTTDGSQINNLWNWTRNSGTQFWNYKFENNKLSYSTQGTGAWAICGNGTFAGSHVGHTVLNDVMIAGDGVGSTRHSTDGISFTDTPVAPIAEYFENYQGRVYAGGTSSNLFYSTVGTASDWVTDSTSILIPDAGKINGVFKQGNYLFTGKNSGKEFRWDGYTLEDLCTELGYTSIYSMGEIEGYKIGLNRMGFYGNGGGKPEILSNAIQKQIYNNAGSAIAGTVFNTAPGIAYRYDYLCSVGTTTDDYTNMTTPNAVIKYDAQLNEWIDWSLANRPTAFATYNDGNGNEQLIWGDINGQCYQLSGTATSDNGQPIQAILMGFISGSSLAIKKWDWIRTPVPSQKCLIQIAISDSAEPLNLNWITLDIPKKGWLEYHFPPETRSRFVFWKLSESSTDTRFKFYGFEYSFDIVEH